MKFEIYNQLTRMVQATIEIECDENASYSSKLGSAILQALKNTVNLCGASLSGAYLRGAYLRGASLNGANLSGANLSYANLSDADLSYANLYYASLSGAYLSDAELSYADLRRAYLSGAYLRRASLSGASLSGASLSGAYLSDADLSYADLRYANLGDQWIIQGPVRSDNYAFFLMKLKDEKEPKIRAGCRWFSIDEARQHWLKTRGGTPLGDETFAILDFLERTAAIRGLMTPSKENQSCS